MHELVEGEEDIGLGWSIGGHSSKRRASRQLDGEGVHSAYGGGQGFLDRQKAME